MKKSIYIALVPGVILVGAVVLFASYRSSPAQSTAFSPEEAKAAAELAVTQPPPPAPPVWVAVAEKVKETVTGVSSETASLEKYAQICTGGKASDFECFEGLYTTIINEKGIPAAFADLKVRYEKNAYVKSQCHPLTHVIGRVAAQSFAEVSGAYKEGDSFCWSGYYHGVLETFIGRIGLRNLAAKIDTVCSALNKDGRYSFDYFNCVHGLGHGLMAITDDELFQSLKFCDSLTGDWEQQSCGGGVYMENIIVDGLNHVTKYLDPKRPLYPCDESPDKYKGTCYLMQTSYMLKINNGNFTKTFEWCRDAGQFQAICNQSLGRDASGRTVSDGPKTRATCMLGSDTNEKANCIIGAVKDFISYFHSDKQAKAFCALFDDEVLKKTCTETATSYYKSF